MLLTLAVAVPGEVVAARIDGGAELHADTDKMLATPMHAPTRAVRKAVQIRELNIFPRKDQSDNRLVRNVAPSANDCALMRTKLNEAGPPVHVYKVGIRGSNPLSPIGRLTAAVELVNV